MGHDTTHRLVIAAAPPSRYCSTVPINLVGPSDGDFRWSIDVQDTLNTVEMCAGVDAALHECDHGPVQLWLHEVEPLADRALINCGWSQYRDLWQLRRPLPAPPSNLETRSFTVDDIDDFVAVNNRAFSWHPEQSGLTPTDVEKSMSEPWFDTDGFRLLHINGRMAGFCWTKVHADIDPPIGEIYLIAIDPDFHGRGLGAPMTLAGLEWLADRGLATGMLYVESDNVAANAVYRRLGFLHHHTDRAYRRTEP